MTRVNWILSAAAVFVATWTWPVQAQFVKGNEAL